MKLSLTLLLALFASSLIFAQPTNDNCSNAVVDTIPWFTPNCQFTTLNATPSTPNVFPAGLPPNWSTGVNQDVWFSFVSTGSWTDTLTLTIEGCDTFDFEPKYALYKGNCNVLVLVSDNAQQPYSGESTGNSLTVKLKLDPYTTHYLRIDNGITPTTPGGDFGLTIIPSYCNAVVPVVTDLTVCQGETITLNPPISNGLAYDWSPSIGLIDFDTISSPQAVINSPMIYNCLATDSLGCPFVAITTVEVPDTIQPVILGTSALSVYPSTTNCTWYFANDSANFAQNAQVAASGVASFSVMNGGYYQAVITDSTGTCSYASPIKWVNILSTNTVSLIQNIEISPNPTSDILNIRFDNLENQIVEITLLNSLGQLIINKKIDSQKGMTNQKIDVSTIPKGNYFLQIKTNNEVITKNVLIVD